MAAQREQEPQRKTDLNPNADSKPGFVTEAERQARARANPDVRSVDVEQRGNVLKIVADTEGLVAPANIQAPARPETPTKTRVEEEAERILKEQEEIKPQEPPQPPEPPEPPKKPWYKKMASWLLKTRLGRAVLASVIGVTGSEIAYQTNETIHEGVDNNLRKFGLDVGEISIPQTFDNSKVKINIGDNNIKRLSQEEIRALDLAPKYNSETKTLTYLFPFKMPPGTTATLDKTPRVRAGNDPKALGINESPLIKFSTAGVEIIAPADSQMELFQGNEDFGVDPNFTNWVVFYHYDPTKDETKFWSFTSTVGDKPGAFEPLLPMKKFNPKEKFNLEELPTVKEGISAARTTDLNQAIDINVRVDKGKIIGTPTQIKPFSQFPTDSSSQDLISL